MRGEIIVDNYGQPVISIHLLYDYFKNYFILFSQSYKSKYY
jgi:hypothetical protein